MPPHQNCKFPFKSFHKGSLPHTSGSPFTSDKIPPLRTSPSVLKPTVPWKVKLVTFFTFLISFHYSIFEAHDIQYTRVIKFSNSSGPQTIQIFVLKNKSLFHRSRSLPLPPHPHILQYYDYPITQRQRVDICP